ncbi:MAG: hypothetical protein IJB15_13105, partial [Clostridia bacterium]|nr:hypothetical protein [Clostridia bacterium]
CCMIYHYFWGFLTALFLTFPESRPEGHPLYGHRKHKPAVRQYKINSPLYGHGESKPAVSRTKNQKRKKSPHHIAFQEIPQYNVP